MENHYFKTAEFAALCGVRKDTLLHYDHIGLLKPQWVGENGYRYYAAQQLRSEGIEPVAYWYNPNIHPYQEYKARRDTLMAYAPTIGMELIVQENYGLREFCRAVCGDIDHRCGVCYTLRLAQAAQYAARHGYDSFTTTLLVSPYQNHELLAETAERMGREYGVRFLYRDFRPGFRQGQQEARALGFYMQKYCGCVFSEEDRYQRQILRDQKEPEKHILPS